MFLWHTVVGASLLFAVLSHATPYQRHSAFAPLSKRMSANTSSLQVDLGYNIYQGFPNATTGINTWKGFEVPCSYPWAMLTNLAEFAMLLHRLDQTAGRRLKLLTLTAT